MNLRHLVTRGPLAALPCVLLLLAASARADVNLVLTPSQGTVAANTEFDVFVDLSGASASFNGFSLVLGYDPTRLQLMPMAPTSQQEGCLMTGLCSASCGSTFHSFSAAGDSVVINDYLFCNQTAVSGPGRLYRLHFKSTLLGGPTSVVARRATFYNAGVQVNPVHASNALITLSSNVGVGDRAAGALALHAQPNPAYGRLRLVLEGGDTGSAEADILDLMGRRVRHLGPVTLGAVSSLEWDGLDEHGAPARGGLYLARVSRGSRVHTTRFVLVR